MLLLDVDTVVSESVCFSRKSIVLSHWWSLSLYKSQYVVLTCDQENLRSNATIFHNYKHNIQRALNMMCINRCFLPLVFQSPMCMLCFDFDSLFSRFIQFITEIGVCVVQRTRCCNNALFRSILRIDKYKRLQNNWKFNIWKLLSSKCDTTW